MRILSKGDIEDIDAYGLHDFQLFWQQLML